MQKEFADKVVDIIKEDHGVIGLAAGGSWITGELDEYSDLDLVLITTNKIAGDKEKMLSYAKSFGDLISGFTGEHVGESRLLICLYDNPLLHVDIKFLTLSEFHERIENPVVLFEREDELTAVIDSTQTNSPVLDYQWVEDRFWTWIHYTCLKIGRGELLEAFDFLSFLRMTVLSPLLQIKNNKQPRGLRKAETQLSLPDLEYLKSTIAQYDKASIIKGLENSVHVYRLLRKKMFSPDIQLQSKAEQRSLDYLEEIKKS